MLEESSDEEFNLEDEPEDDLEDEEFDEETVIEQPFIESTPAALTVKPKMVSLGI